MGHHGGTTFWAEGTVSTRVLGQGLKELRLEYSEGGREKEMRMMRMDRWLRLSHFYPVGCGKEFYL